MPDFGYVDVRRARRPDTPAEVMHVSPRETVDFWSFLPRWSYDGGVADIARQEYRTRRGITALPMSDCVGPAIKWAQLCVLVLWLGTLGLVVLSYQVTGCTEEGFVRTPNWLWFTYAPVLVACCGLEFVCLRYTVVPFVQVFQGRNSGPFEVFGLPVAYHVWGLYMAAQSTLARVDMATDSFFAVRVMRAETCPGNMDAEIWEAVMRQSCFPFLSGIHLSHVTIMIYLLSVTQLVWPLLLSTPGCQDEGSIDYSVGVTTPEGRKPNRAYGNMVCEQMLLGDTLMMLAEASSMCALQNQSPAYPRAKELYARERGEWPRSLRLTRNALSRGVVRIGLVAVLENSFQIQLQVSLFAIKRYSAKGKGSQINSAVSITVSILMLMLKLLEAWKLLQFSSEVRTAFYLEHPDFQGTREAEAREMASYGEHTPRSGASKLQSVSAASLLEPPPSPGRRRADLVQEYGAVMKYTRVLQLMVLVLVFGTAFASVKLVMAFRCRDSLWNVTGCAVLGDHLGFRPRDHA